MTVTTQPDLIALVEQDLAKVQRRATALRRRHLSFVIAATIASSLAALLAGGMALGGPELANQIGGWRTGCSLAALLSLAATTATTLQDRLRLSEHLASSSACAALLSALRFSLRAGLSDLRQAQEHYRGILEKYNGYLS
jgi:hypothetical protein